MSEKLEQAILSGCLTELIVTISNKVRPEFFTDSTHRSAYEHFIAFFQKTGVPFSKEAFSHYIKEFRVDEKIKLKALLETLSDNPDRAYILVRLQDFINDYKKRELLSIQDDISNVQTGKDSEIRERVEGKLRNLASLEKDIPDSIDMMSPEFLERFTKYLEKIKDPKKGLLTGLHELDDAIGGGLAGELWVYMGGTSHGKSTILANHCYHLAVELGKNCVFVSAEMSIDDIGIRLAAIHASKKFNIQNFNLKNLKGGKIQKETEKIFVEAAKDLMTNPKYGKIIHMYATNDQNIRTIHNLCEEVNKKVPLDAIFVDYFDKLGALDPKKSGWEAKGDTYQYAKANMALGFNKNKGILVVSAHQVKTESVERASRSKGMYKAEDSAHTAEAHRIPDVIIGIFKASDVVSNEGEEKPTAFGRESILTVCKNRNGDRYPEVKLITIEAEFECGCLRSFDDVSPNFELSDKESGGNLDLDLDMDLDKEILE